jgi:hypothetical protein
MSAQPVQVPVYFIFIKKCVPVPVGRRHIAEKQCPNLDPDLIGLIESEPDKMFPKKEIHVLKSFLEAWSSDVDWIRIQLGQWIQIRIQI